MASDAAPGHFQQPQAMPVSLQVEDPTDAERAVQRAGRWRQPCNMPFGKTVLLAGVRQLCVDKFGMSWMVNCPMEGM